MSNGTGAWERGVVSGGDREARNLLLWLLFAGLGVAVVASLGTLTLLSGPRSPPYQAAAIPPLAEAPPQAEAPPNSSHETAAPSASLAPAPDIFAEPTSGVPQPQLFPQRAKRDVAGAEANLPLPPPRPAFRAPPERPQVGDAVLLSAARDPATAVYDIAAHTVYLPDGTRLEAHSGLGAVMDDPHFVNEADRGATPPHLYELSMREAIFHGVQALRLNPIGEGDMYGRNGLLAHPYMLGPKGDSNGCVSFRDYDAFLKAYQNGQVKRLAVVARLD